MTESDDILIARATYYAEALRDANGLSEGQLEHISSCGAQISFVTYIALEGVSDKENAALHIEARAVYAALARRKKREALSKLQARVALIESLVIA